MKKLMIAVAIVCAAVVSQAASIDWGVNNFAWKDASGSDPAKNSMVYLINGDTALDTIVKAISDGNLESQNWYYGSAKTSNTKGYIGKNTLDGGTKLVAGTSYNFSALMIDGDKYMVSDVKSQKAYTPGVDEALGVTFGSDQFGVNALTYDAATAKDGWASVSAVPEPTSAMLLLLGVAGLALRRRRA